MDAATIQDYPQNETFGEILASLREIRAMNKELSIERQKELDRLSKENEKRQKELKEQMQETDKLIQETAMMQKETDRMQKETDKLIQETARRQKETDKQIDKVSQQMGFLGNSFGELAEHLVAPNIVKKFQNLGFKVEKCSKNIEIYKPDLSKIITEIDLFLENGDIAIVVEVKAKLREKHLEEFINKMEKIREYADRKQDKRKFIGAIAAAIMDKDQMKKILGEGIYVIEQTGETMKIVAPEGFKPREF